MEDYKKKYEEALENFKKIKAANKDNKELVNFIEYEYPELKESEDERIRKEIIQSIQDNMCVLHKDKYIAWLEKQGKESAITTALKAELKPYKDGNKWCILLGDNTQEGICGFGDTADEALFEFLKELAEKAGEQKLPNNEEYQPVSKVLGGVYEAEQALEQPEQGEQKPADKTKSKFKIGDWIIQENFGVYKIIEICKSWYEVIDFKDHHHSICFDIEHTCRLWTIQDAKDGDILAVGSGIFIFDGTVEDGIYPFAYCGLTRYGFEYYDRKLPFTHDNNVYPATKEQRDLLFTKMKEAGYEWDAEKKELKKIELKSAWSEEDETKIKNIIAFLEEPALCCMECNRDIVQENIDWLKSLKYRVQPKQEWSEEDEEIIEGLNNCLDELKKKNGWRYTYVNNKDVELDKIRNWLKSLKERYTWKPSDEQMDFLWKYAEQNNYNGAILTSLFRDLKNLREE